MEIMWYRCCGGLWSFSKFRKINTGLIFQFTLKCPTDHLGLVSTLSRASVQFVDEVWIVNMNFVRSDANNGT